jgi:cytochrome c-type biogenesis protein CcmH
VSRARWREILTGRVAWVLLAAVVVATLAIGSVHPGASSESARISRLDSIIKCPSCDDLSIAQSDASTAVTLRAVVAADVHAGESDARIEAYVVARYGPSILLQPSNPLVWVLPIAGIAIAAGALGVVMWRRHRGSRAAVDAGEGDEDERLVAAALSERRGEERVGVEH